MCDMDIFMSQCPPLMRIQLTPEYHEKNLDFKVKIKSGNSFKSNLTLKGHDFN